MRIITNPGSNLTDEIVRRYRVEVPRSHIVVDGVEHDTRLPIPHRVVDSWVKNAKEHPHVLGTSAVEFIDLFKRLSADDRELVAIMTSRKIIGSHTGATSAAKTLAKAHGYEDLRISVIDTKTTDLGAAMCTIVAGEAIKAGRSIDEVTRTVEKFAEGGVFALTLATLDNLVKGGRASFLRAWIANMLNITPIITFEDGELNAAGRVSRSKNVPAAMADFILQKLGGRRSVWVGISHGGVPREAAALASELGSRFDVVHQQIREAQSSIYLHIGRGGLGAFVHPVDALDGLPVPPLF